MEIVFWVTVAVCAVFGAIQFVRNRARAREENRAETQP
jgi:hypothetical protein